MKTASLSTVLLLLLVASGALASEQSERLYSRGLVEFHAQHYAAALKLFDQAVQADPNDPYALYYRGVTHGRLGDYSAAVTDLRAAVAKKPDLPQAPLELGGALVQAGNNRDAVPWLETAQRDPASEGQASLLLGVAQFRLGDLEAARANLTRAATADPTLAVQARYYQGVVDYRAGRIADAQAQFSYVADTSPESAVGREAAAFLERMIGGAPPPYQLYGGVGFQYDSNVVLAPSNEVLKQALAISQQSDERFTLNAGGIYTLAWPSAHANLSLGYDFFQSLHIDLHQFNLQDHRLSAQLVTNQGPLQFGILARYDYYFIDDEQSFLQEGLALPWMTLSEGANGRTEIFYRMRRRDFLKHPYTGVLDAFNNAVGVRQFYYLGAPERFLVAGYRFDNEDPVNSAGNQYGYNGNEANAGIGWAFPWGISAEADYAFRREIYQEASAATAPAGERRKDSQNEVVAAVSKQLTPHLRVTAAYFGTFNDSNKPVFEYNRNVASLAFEVLF
jgi:tetratricopeptide (TPR) repeat protein